MRTSPFSLKQTPTLRAACYRLAFLAGFMVTISGCGASDTVSRISSGSGIEDRSGAASYAAAQGDYDAGAADEEPAAEEVGDRGVLAGIVGQEEGEGETGDDGAAGVGDDVLAVDPSRRVIKDGTMSLLVDNVQLALSRIEAIAVGAGGYVLETTTDYGRRDGRRATLRMAVPVDSFEDTLQRLRDVATEVQSETASGKDVTQEYVNLEAQIANLEATRARVRTFLDQADTVDEALNVNARLTEIEGQIAERKGRLRVLARRSSYSTIALQLQEPAQPITPDPTATPAPLPEWSASATASDAFRMLRSVLRGLASVVIWMVIIGVPVLIPIAAGVWLLLWLKRRVLRAQQDRVSQGDGEG